MNARFYAPDAHAPGDVIALPEDEAEHLDARAAVEGRRHAARLQRTRPRVRCDGRRRAGKGGVRVRVGEAAQPAPEPRVAITLAQAVLKGDKMDDVVRDATMLGVAAIQPIMTARTEVTRASLTREQAARALGAQSPSPR